MDANADPNRDLEDIIKFIFGKAPEPFWVRKEAGFLALQKIWLMVLVKTRAYRYCIGRETVSINSLAIRKYKSFKKPKFYDLLKMTLLIISVSNKL